MKAQIEANIKEHAAAVKAKQEAFLAEQAAMRAAHLAVETARREREAAAIAAHKQAMMERRKEFEKRFKHVWSTGPAGISKYYVTAPTQAAGEKLIAELLAKTLTADVKQQHVNWRRDI
jgi:cytidylate kinase